MLGRGVPDVLDTHTSTEGLPQAICVGAVIRSGQNDELMRSCEFRQDMEAALTAAGGERPQAAHFDPEDAHGAWMDVLLGA